MQHYTKYGPYATKQLGDTVRLPVELYQHGLITWKPHKSNQKYITPNDRTPNKYLLMRLTRLLPKQYIELPAGANTDIPWEQIKMFAAKCRNKGCQFRVVKQIVDLPTNQRVCRLWRTE